MLDGFNICVEQRQVPETAWELRRAKALIKLLALSPTRRLQPCRAAPLLRGFARGGMLEWRCSLSALRPLVE